jgi:purine nucleosidase
MEKIMIDTDIGTDVDDLLALVYALKHPKIEVVGITTVDGDARKRAKIASAVCSLLGQKIPVYAGAEKPLVLEKSWMLPYTGEGIDYDKARIEKRMAYEYVQSVFKKTEIRIACIAPMTNIALALQNQSQYHIYNNVIIMGISGSHNHKVDPDAADMLLKRSFNMTCITTETAKKAYLTLDEISTIRTGIPALDQAIVTNAKNWLAVSPYKDRCYLYDPLVIASIVHPELFTYEHKDGKKICTDVDGEQFKKEFLEVIQQ